MTKYWKKIFFRIVTTFLLLIVVTSSSQVYASQESLIDLNKGNSYSSKDLYNISKKLAEKYPEILHFEEIGKSVDKKPIYSLILTGNIKEGLNRDDFNIYKKHYYVEGGTHARELTNPIIVIKLIEDYAKDYYNDSHIKEFNVKDVLNKSVIHFIPLVNPDGFDLVKFGKGSIQTEEALKALNSVNDTNYRRWKANIKGVDLNRNFPNEVVDSEGNWINNFQKYPNNFHSWVPHREFYGGEYGGSEPETQAIMKYIQKYDFRNFLSYHSRGNVIYTAKKWFSNEYNAREKSLGELASRVSGYTLIHHSDGTGSGYFSDFTASRTLKPNVTVETTVAEVPIDQMYFKEAYDRTYLLPLHFTNHGEKQGYFKYRLYINNKYVRDFPEELYAKANAELFGGVVVEGEGKPELYLDEPITRSESLNMVMNKYFVLNKIYYNPIEAVPSNARLELFKDNKVNIFRDDYSPTSNFARFIGILIF